MRPGTLGDSDTENEVRRKIDRTTQPSTSRRTDQMIRIVPISRLREEPPVIADEADMQIDETVGKSTTNIILRRHTAKEGEEMDECDLFGVLVASKLRCMTPQQRLLAEKKMIDVMFDGQLNKLSL